MLAYYHRKKFYVMSAPRENYYFFLPRLFLFFMVDEFFLFESIDVFCDREEKEKSIGSIVVAPRLSA